MPRTCCLAARVRVCTSPRICIAPADTRLPVGTRHRPRMVEDLMHALVNDRLPRQVHIHHVVVVFQVLFEDLAHPLHPDLECTGQGATFAAFHE